MVSSNGCQKDVYRASDDDVHQDIICFEGVILERERGCNDIKVEVWLIKPEVAKSLAK